MWKISEREEKIKYIVEQYKLGKSIKQIARDQNGCAKTVAKILRDQKIEIKSRLLDLTSLSLIRDNYIKDNSSDLLNLCKKYNFPSYEQARFYLKKDIIERKNRLQLEREKLFEKSLSLFDQGFQIKKIAEELNLNEMMVAKYLKDHHKYDNLKNISSSIISDIITDYSDGKYIQDIKKQRNISSTTIKKYLTQNNIELTNHIKYDINENYLDVIDFKDKAYFLGWMFSDGNVNKTIQRIGIQIKGSDIAILKTISSYISKDDLVITREAKHYRDGYSANLRIHRPHLARRLNELGCVPNKSKILIINDLLKKDMPEELWSHFIRGYLDGDGWCSLKIDKNNKHILGVGICSASVDILNFFQEKLLQNNITSFVYQGRIYSFHIKKCDLEKFYNYLYKDCGDCKLERKYKNYTVYVDSLDKSKS
jgi:DNA-binding CsgD family transcriptional regulator